MNTEVTPEFFKKVVADALQRLKVIDGTVINVSESMCLIEIHNELVKMPHFAVVFNTQDTVFNVYILRETDTPTHPDYVKPIATIRNSISAMEVTMAIHMLYSNPPIF